MTTGGPTPCPVCGTQALPEAEHCEVCGHALRALEATNAGADKCARCGSEIPPGCDFCPICGQDQRCRRARPATAVLGLNVGHEGAEPSPPEGLRRSDTMVADHPPEPSCVDARPSTRAEGSAVSSEATLPPEGTALRVRLAFPGEAPPAPLPSLVPTTPGLQPIRLALVEEDGREHRTIPLVGPSLTLGRTQGDLFFEHDAFLSPVHARLERRADRLFLIDLNSRNGIFLRLREPTPLAFGTTIACGQQVLQFEHAGVVATIAAPDGDGTRWYGTPLTPPWGKLVRLQRDAEAQDYFYLRRASITLGRESGDFVFPDDPFVSRQHARLRLVADGSAMQVVLEDLGSANGTYVRIQHEVEVVPGDTFRIGDQLLRLRRDA